MHSLSEAALGAGDQLVALNRWNRSGKTPQRNGFARPLPEALQASFARPSASGVALRGGGWLASTLRDDAVWGTSIYVARSNRLRLELSAVELPEGSRLWVWGETEAPIAFDLSLRSADGTLWTPSVAGPTLYLEVQVPAEATAGSLPAFRASQILEIFQLGEDGEARVGSSLDDKVTTSCLIDAACVTEANFPGISNLKKAIAHLEFVVGGSGVICSGGMLNNTRNDFTPYLLTANHCISTQPVASSLEAFWDFIDSSCGGSAPALSSLPRSSGATLLSASANSDFSLLRLSSAPGSRVFLGWNSQVQATAIGTSLFRLSHPLGFSMQISKSLVWAPPQTCVGASATNFLYSDPQPELSNGATFGGSSGSPVFLGNGQVVGQLLGACGPNSGEPCLAASQDSTLDGRFSQSFASLSAFLSPSTNTTPCVTGVSTACLQGGRFEVKVAWQTAATSGAAQVMSFGGQRAENSDSAFFWFFTSTNFEMGLKILNACGLNNKFWVFISGLTDQGWTVNVRDTTTGATKSYSNALGHLTSTTADTAALSCP